MRIAHLKEGAGLGSGLLYGFLNEFVDELRDEEAQSEEHDLKLASKDEVGNETP